MKTNTLFGLAFLSYNKECNKGDIADVYIPLICDCIVKIDNSNRINLLEIQTHFSMMYGVELTPGFIASVLKRCCHNGLLSKSNDEYSIIDIAKISELTNKYNRENIENDFDHIISDISKYSLSSFNKEVSSQEIEDNLLQLLRDYDTDLLVTSDHGLSALSKIKESKAIKYIISKYIIDVSTAEPENFNKILGLAKGHSIASIVSNSNLSAYSGNLNSVDVFLDAPIIFNLLGLNGDYNLALIKDLIELLTSHKANLKIFSVNYLEVASTIQDAIERLRSGDYKLHYSSRVLKSAVSEGKDATFLELKLSQLESVLEKYSIEICDFDDFNVKYSIDEQKLTDSIKNIYSHNHNWRINNKAEQTIDRDVSTIANIFQRRKNCTITSIKNCKALLLTTNTAIAYASNFEGLANSQTIKPSIPPCITDIFLSTVLWTNFPQKEYDKLKMRQLISLCSSNIEINDSIFKKFYRDIEKMHAENAFTDEIYYTINSGNVASKILLDLTMNDDQLYTDATPREVAERVIASYRQDAINLKEDVDTAKEQVRHISSFIAIIIFYTIWFVLVIVTFYLRWGQIFIEHQLNIFWQWVINISAFALTGWGLFRWIGLIPSKSEIVEKLSQYFNKKINSFLFKNKK